MTTGPLRPLTIGELLDRTFALYREHFGLFFGITALPHLFSFALGLFANPLRIYLGLNFLGWVWLGALISVLVGAVAHAATVMAVSEIYLDRTTGVIDAYSKVQFNIVGVILLSLLVAMGAGLGAFFFVVPGILLALKWSLVVPIAVLEDQGIIDSMSRSASLTKGYRWRVFVIWILFFALSLSMTLLFQWPVQIATASAITHHARYLFPWLNAASTLLKFISACLAGPLATIAFSLLYYDLRVRKEAFDLQYMMDALDSMASSSAQPSSVLT